MMGLHYEDTSNIGVEVGDRSAGASDLWLLTTVSDLRPLSSDL